MQKQGNQIDLYDVDNNNESDTEKFTHKRNIDKSNNKTKKDKLEKDKLEKVVKREDSIDEKNKIIDISGISCSMQIIGKSTILAY